ncbi:MAG: ribonuclease P protein component 1 [Methanobacteriaceae archaeon]|jgi:ribonuclease P protein subunit POP4|nr:ribonuclease P protein component 1 [Candidatus Methanorudis spinitermitis]
MISSKNIFYHELIGLCCEVIESSNKSFVGVNGKIIDETKNTVLIETFCENGVKEKLIPKDFSVFHFKLPNGNWVEIHGKLLVSRPEDRIKKKFKKI